MNSPARPFSKFKLFKSIHGEGIASVAIVVWDSLANPLAVDTETCDGIIVVVYDGGIVCDGGISSVVVILELYLGFVFKISGSVRSCRFAGFHPLSLIALWLLRVLENDLCQHILNKGMASDFSISDFIPFLVFHNTNFAFSLANSTL